MLVAVRQSATLPRRLHNSNFLRAVFEWAIVAAFFWVATVSAADQTKWLPAALAAAATFVVVVYAISWAWADLLVSEDGVRVGGVFRRRSLRWDEIGSFAIREPWKRTPFMLSFAWWIDQARVTLVDGSRIRVRAVEPWHGFTVWTFVAIQRRTAADETVSWLNRLRSERCGE